MRRLTNGLLGAAAESRILDWRGIEFLRGNLQAAAAGRDYHRVVEKLHPARIARLTDTLPYLHAAELLLMLPPDLAADTCEDLLPERQAQILTELPAARAADLLARMAPDLAADALGALAFDDARELLQMMPEDSANRVERLLRFPPDTAGGIMTNDYVFVLKGTTVQAAVDFLREQAARPDFVYFVYVVEDENSRRLSGVLTLRDLLLAEPNQSVDAVMTTDVFTVAPLEAGSAVAQRIADYGFNAVPVVDGTGAILGIITVDTALAQIIPEAWRSRLPRVFS
jgi:Mg/Co/Ni transporter MgtE